MPGKYFTTANTKKKNIVIDRDKIIYCRGLFSHLREVTENYNTFISSKYALEL